MVAERQSQQQSPGGHYIPIRGAPRCPGVSCRAYHRGRHGRTCGHFWGGRHHSHKGLSISRDWRAGSRGPPGQRILLLHRPARHKLQPRAMQFPPFCGKVSGNNSRGPHDALGAPAEVVGFGPETMPLSHGSPIRNPKFNIRNLQYLSVAPGDHVHRAPRRHQARRARHGRPQDRAHANHPPSDTASRSSSCSPLIAEELKTLSKEIRQLSR